MSEDFSDLLEEFLDDDAKDSFVKLLKSHKTVVDGYLVNQCISFRAFRCITALLNGEATDHPVTLSDTNLADLIWEYHFPPLFDLLITRCDGSKLVDALEDPVLGLPLSYMRYQAPLCHWSPGQSLFKLIFLLFQSKWRTYFDSARLVAKYSNRVNDTAWMFLEDQDIVEFAATLLVAPGKVMLPFPSGLTIKERIRKELNATRDDSEEDLKYKLALMEAQKLLQIFERVGEPLSTLHASMPKYVPVAKVVTDVAGVLIKAGFFLSYEDLNVSGYFSYRASLKNLPKCIILDGGDLHVGHTDYSSTRGSMWKAASSTPVIGRRLQDIGVGILQAASVPAASMPTVRTFTTFQVAGGLLKIGEDPLVSPKAISISNISAVATSNCQVSVMCKGMNQAFPSSSLKHLAYVAEKLKKGIKFL